MIDIASIQAARENLRGQVLKTPFTLSRTLSDIFGAEIWLNGKPVKVDEPSWGRENYHEGGWTAFQVDLTPHVKFGEIVGRAVRTATLEALRWQNGLEPSLTRGLFHALGRYGVREQTIFEDLEGLLEAAPDRGVGLGRGHLELQLAFVGGTPQREHPVQLLALA